MNTNLKLLLSLCIILILGFVFVNIDHTPSKPNYSSSPSTLLTKEESIDPNIFELVAVQIDPEHPLTHEEIMKGNNGFLMYKNGTDDTVYLFNTLASLANYDRNKDGLVTAIEPEYPDMYFAFFDPEDGVFKYFPLSKVGVGAISYNFDYLEMENANDIDRFASKAGTATFADGSKMPIKVVPVPAEELKSKNFVPVQNKE